MEHDSDSTGDFQRSTRMPLDAVVRLHFEGTVAYQNGFAANVSATGMFVKHPAPPPVGTRLVFEFSLGVDRAPVQGSGEVVWVRDRYLGPGQPAGVGIRFHQLDSQSRDHVAEALFQYLERSLAEDSTIDTQRLAGQIGAQPDAIASLADAMPLSRPESPPRMDLASLPQISPPATASAARELRMPELAPEDAGGAVHRQEPLGSPAAAPSEPSTAPPASYGAAPEAAERHPFTVFSPLDSADASTAAIVREALRDAPPPAISLGGAAHAASASGTGPARSPGLWIALGLAIAVAAGWFAWQRWGVPAAPPPAAEAAPVEPERPKPEPLSAAPDPSTTLAEAVGVDPSARSPAAEPPISRAPTGQPEGVAPGEAVAAGEPSDVGAAGESAVPGTEPVDKAVPVTVPSPAESAPPSSPPGQPAAAAAATKVVGLAWRDAAGRIDLVITADAAFAPGSFSYSEIGGENPRVLVKLRGMESPFRGAASGATALARGVRSGFHVGTKGNEIHLVVDLARPAAKVEALTPDGAALVLTLAPR